MFTYPHGSVAAWPQSLIFRNTGVSKNSNIYGLWVFKGVRPRGHKGKLTIILIKNFEIVTPRIKLLLSLNEYLVLVKNFYHWKSKARNGNSWPYWTFYLWLPINCIFMSIVLSSSLNVKFALDFSSRSNIVKHLNKTSNKID